MLRREYGGYMDLRYKKEILDMICGFGDLLILRLLCRMNIFMVVEYFYGISFYMGVVLPSKLTVSDFCLL